MSNFTSKQAAIVYRLELEIEAWRDRYAQLAKEMERQRRIAADEVETLERRVRVLDADRERLDWADLYVVGDFVRPGESFREALDAMLAEETDSDE